MQRCIVLALVLGLTGAVRAIDLKGGLLNDNANPANCDVLKDESGRIIVYGTEGTWAGNHTKEQVFDGNFNGDSNYFDPPETPARQGGCWAGIGFERPKIVTKIRIAGRSEQLNRATDCLIQGANSADFSDAVTIHVVKRFNSSPSEQWVCNPETGAFAAYRYFRIFGPNAYSNSNNNPGEMAGNCAELEFYGFDAEASELEQVGAPQIPYVNFAAPFNRHMNIAFTPGADTLAVVIRRTMHDEERPEIVSAMDASAGTKAWFLDETAISSETLYEIRAINPVGESDWIALSAPDLSALSGDYIGTAGSYNNMGDVGAKVFDGNVCTHFDSTDADSNSAWVGLDFGEVREVGSIRYMPRSEFPERMTGGKFQIAQDAGFSDPVTIAEVSGIPSVSGVNEIVLPQPVFTRFIRYLAPSGSYGNVAEIEFDAINGILTVPSDFAVENGDSGVVLSWTARGGSSMVKRVLVYRSSSQFGPWESVVPGGLGLDVTSYVDTGCEPGMEWWYALAYADETAETVGNRCEALSVSLAGVLLERDSASDNGLREGCSFISRGVPYNNEESAGPKAAFDGSVATSCDLSTDDTWKTGNDVAFGVDFGADTPVIFRSAVACSRNDNYGNWGRLNGVVVCGSNDDNWYENYEVLSEPFAVTGSSQWITVNSQNGSFAAYRYLFVRKLDPNAEFWGNVAELLFYGIRETDTDLVAPPAEVELVAGSEGTLVSWSAGLNAQSYRVERKDGEESEWRMIADGIDGLSYMDDTVVYDGTYYSYRVSSVSGETAYASHVTTKCLWVPASGTGLWGRYFGNYFPNAAGEVFAGSGFAPTVQFDWGHGGPWGLTDNFMASWTGKLVVPFDGDYTFGILHDDGAAIFIDGSNAYGNHWSSGGNGSTTRHLTAGEHDFVVLFRENGGNAFCLLTWGGAVEAGPIPASQLIPVVPDELPPEWNGSRAFGSGIGYCEFDQDDESYVLHHSSGDFWEGNDNTMFVWRELEGDFIASARIESLAKDNNSKFGLMFRNEADNVSPVVSFNRTAYTQPSRFGWDVKGRLTAGGSIGNMAVQPSDDYSLSGTCYLRIRRNGNKFDFSLRETVNDPWTVCHTYVDEANVFEKRLLIGLSAHSYPGISSIARFSEVSICGASGLVIFVR